MCSMGMGGVVGEWGGVVGAWENGAAEPYAAIEPPL